MRHGRRHRSGIEHFPLARFLGHRLHRKLFAYFAATISLTAILVVLTGAFSRGVLGVDWHRERQRIERFTSERFARVWRDSASRDELARATAEALELRVTLRDAEGAALASFGPACDGQVFVVPIEDGAPMGTVGFCIAPKRYGNESRVLLPLLVALLVLWAAAGKLARRFARPLAEVAQVARQIGEGKLASRAQLHHGMPGEIGILADAINDMAIRIERQIEDQRALLATVSHELRTPLGHARILLELLRESGGDPKNVGEMERELEELDTLVGELLASSRLDFSILNLHALHAIDLAKRALDRAGLGEDLLEVDTSEGSDPSLRADPTLLGRALANLVDNAKKHGGGLVRLRIRLRPSVVRFELDDEGPGIDPSADLFTPFYRGAGDATGGSQGALGLGLSLVKRIAEAHRGIAFAASRTEGGARVGFELPRDPAG